MPLSDDKPGLVSGKKIIWWTVVLCVLVLLPVTERTLRWVESRAVPSPPLSWAEREQWRTPTVDFTRLQKEPGPQPPFIRIRRNLDFEVSEAEEQAVRDLALIGWTIDEPTDQRAAIEAIVAKQPDLFYARYMLAQWERIRGEADEATYARLMEEALALTPKVVMMRFVDPLGQPLANLRLGTVEVAAALLRDSVLNEQLRLVYPDLTTDARGQIYLPIYDTPARTTVLPQLETHDLVYNWEGWFEFPGQTAALPTVEGAKRRGL